MLTADLLKKLQDDYKSSIGLGASAVVAILHFSACLILIAIPIIVFVGALFGLYYMGLKLS